jgi:serine/threonine-protein kinase
VGNTQTVSELTPGYRLDRYELLCRVAAGGMANIWLARPRDGHGAERLVVLKTILPKFASDAHFQEMFLREGGIASRITHRNVARVFDLGEKGGVLYIAMEYVDGDSLSKLNRECQKKGMKIPPGVVLRILADVCAGLHHAHELRDGTGRLLNVVHRDVTPQNILIGAKGIAKLIDFGIASTHLTSNEDTDGAVLKGKAHFMSPEQALGQAVDRRADIWAVGAVLYHLLAGRPPYDAPEYVQTLRLITSGEPPPPLPLEVHPEVGAVALKALSYAPDDRYQTAQQLHDALVAAMHAANVFTQPAAVASFAEPLLVERAGQRRRAIDLALSAAAERERPGGNVQKASSAGAAGPDMAHGAGALAPSSRLKYAALAAIAVAIGLVVCVLLTLGHTQ